MLLALLLCLVGFGFVVAEVFFVSFGMLALVALGLFLIADMIAFESSSAAGWGLIVAQVVLIPVLVRLAFRVLPRLPFGRAMLLSAPAKAPEAGVPALSSLVGHRGVAHSDLRPGGVAEIDDTRFSVTAIDGFLSAGTPVVVVAVDGSDIQVRTAHTASPPG